MKIRYIGDSRAFCPLCHAEMEYQKNVDSYFCLTCGKAFIFKELGK